MDQDAFRNLVTTAPGGASNSTSKLSAFKPSRNVFASRGASRGGRLAVPGRKAVPTPQTAPDLKPRKLKGPSVEKTQLHSLLRDLTGHDADDDAQPGSAKGLDMSLIARSRGQEAELDDAAAEDALEAVFSEIVASSSAEPQPSTLSEPGTKKSRAEILAQLKASRSGSGATIKTEGDSSQTSESVASSKFKPIGFKPIGAPEGKKKKKKRVDGAPEGDGESKKKKRKVVIAEAPTTKANSAPSESKITSNAVPASDSAIDDEEDIFADAGEYQGVDLGDSDEEGDTGDLVTSNGVAETTSDQPSVMRRGWFEGEPTPPPTTHTVPVAEMEEGETLDVPSTGDMEAEEPPMRLQPLASSALPSVRDMLAADEALEKEEKRRERKEKRKKA